MKIQDIILDILGILLFAISIYGFYFLEVSFLESTGVGVIGLGLFVLKGSSIRKLILKYISKFTEK